MTIQCCQCKRVRAGEEWTLPGFPPSGSVSYTYCPTCLRQTLAELKAERTILLGRPFGRVAC